MSAENNDILVLIAWLCVRYHVQPSELNNIANMLAEYDAITDARTEMQNA